MTPGWLAARLQAFVDLHPGFDVPVDRLAAWLARADDEDDQPRAARPAIRGRAGEQWCGTAWRSG